MSSSKKTYVFAGHVVHCKDLDCGDAFNVEVNINEELPGDKILSAALAAAAKHELVTLSGNSFDFEYIQPSGKRIQQVIIKEITVLAPTNPESEELLESHTLS